MAALPLLGKGKVVPSAAQCEGEPVKACKAERERAEGDGGEGAKSKQKVRGGKKES